MTLSNWSKSEKNGSPCSKMKWKFSVLLTGECRTSCYFFVSLPAGKGREQPRAICAGFLSLFSTKKTGELLSNCSSAHPSTIQVTPDDSRVNSQMQSSNEQSGNSLVGKRSRNPSQAEHNERSLVGFVCYSVKVAVKTEKCFDLSTLETFKMSLQGLLMLNVCPVPWQCHLPCSGSQSQWPGSWQRSHRGFHQGGGLQSCQWNHAGEQECPTQNQLFTTSEHHRYSWFHAIGTWL